MAIDSLSLIAPRLGFATVMTLGSLAGSSVARADSPTPAASADLEQRRMELMRTRAMSLRFRCPSVADFPPRLQAEPVFRYDDIPRGYVDGTVWRLGSGGRPLAIVTTELHPKYLGGDGRVVYDFLSLSPHPFTATGQDVSGWNPPGSAVEMKSLESAVEPAETAAQRLFQMKRLIQRFSATQVVSEDPEEKRLALRLLPRPIDRYTPTQTERGDGAAFLFVAGRMPGIIVFLECERTGWSYGVGRLSAPSTLTVSIDDRKVWQVAPGAGTWSQAYVATNAPAQIPE